MFRLGTVPVDTTFVSGTKPGGVVRKVRRFPELARFAGLPAIERTWQTGKRSRGKTKIVILITVSIFPAMLCQCSMTLEM